MPNYTSKYKLTKPLGTDLYDIEVHNRNMDIIDEALGSHGLSTYTDITQLGLTVGSETVESIVEALPNNSSLVCATGSSNADIYPDGKLGILTIVKVASSRVECKWVQRSTGATYFGNVVDGTWYGWKRVCFQFTSLTQLGITSGSETIEQIVNTLPENSNLIYSVSTSGESIYPTNYGLVTVTKLTTGRVRFEYSTTGGTLFIGMYNVGAASPWTGWKKVYTDVSQPTLDELGGIVPVEHGGTGTSGWHQALANLRAMGRLAQYYSATSAPDIDTILDSLMLIPNDYAKNCPLGGIFVYIMQVFYGGTTATSNRTQIAFPYDSDGNMGRGIAIRAYSNGKWSTWQSVPSIRNSTTDLTAGSSALPSGEVYLVYE